MTSSDDTSPGPITYRDAGVDLDQADRAVRAFDPLARATRRPGVMEGLGGFGALFSLGQAGFGPTGDDETILVSATDGVGTKLKLACALDRHDTIGVDCVAMCVNDVLTTGAQPLFFLDYLATGKLDPIQAAAVVKGIARACAESRCALIGGETAELPGLLAAGEYDVAGFCVGAARRRELWRPEDVQAGDVLVGLASTGMHSNGFSLARAIIARAGLDLHAVYPTLDASRTLGEVLLTPTALYGAALGAMRQAAPITSAAHITGGGVPANLPRALPAHLTYTLRRGAWPTPAIFPFLAAHGRVAPDEQARVWNMGLGMIVAVRGDARAAIDAAHSVGCDAWEVGCVV